MCCLNQFHNIAPNRSLPFSLNFILFGLDTPQSFINELQFDIKNSHSNHFIDFASSEILKPFTQSLISSKQILLSFKLYSSFNEYAGALIYKWTLQSEIKIFPSFWYLIINLEN